MASKVWLLVEWVDESNVFTSYGVVNCDNLAYHESELQPGNVIYIQSKHENPRRAKILRISESKQYVKEHKEILERQDQQFKNVLQLCMQTIKQMKTSNSNVQYNPQLATNQIAAPHVLVASKPESGSDSDSEPSISVNNIKQERSRIQSLNKSKYTSSHTASTQCNRKEAKIHPVRSLMNTSQQRRRSMVSSTPLPSSSGQKVKLCFDQGSQTEEAFLKPPIEKIEAMETVLKNLYRRFQYLVSQVNTNSNGSMSLSDSEHNDEVSYMGNNESMMERNNADEDQRSVEMDDHIQNVGAEEVIDENRGNQPMNILNAPAEDRTNPDMPRVRRMSAQTTNNIETVPSNDNDLVPIGNGNAKVPVRVLQDIDWKSHTTATRQLLQAVFPRNVLATHSLTGKQSPAFMNRPAKKILDPKLVEDIVKIVSTRCSVPKNLVRNSITIKCTDEAKLYRNRQQYKQQRKHIENDENRPPSAPSSDESTNTLIN